MSYEMLLDERDVALDIVSRKPILKIRHGDSPHQIAEHSAAHGAFTVTVDGRKFSGFRAQVGDEVYVRIGARTFIVGLPQARLRALGKGKGADELRADMPGTVIAHHGAAGQAVKAGDRLVTIESMKLQVTLVAARDGVIDTYHVPAETAFDRGALLVSLVAEAPAQSSKAAS
jgi:acetyl/propionyl-CoA carboxylase alpha subunit